MRGGFSGQYARAAASKFEAPGWLCTSATKSTAAAPASCAASALRHAVDGSDVTTPSNGLFDGVVTSEPSTAWRKALAAQEAGAAAVLFVADVHNHPGASNFEAAARAYWPEKPPRIPAYTLASWADRIRIPVAQI